MPPSRFLPQVAGQCTGPYELCSKFQWHPRQARSSLSDAISSHGRVAHLRYGPDESVLWHGDHSRVR